MGMTIGHRIAAAIVAVVLPAYSWHDGSGWLAWRMFSKSETYRLTVRVTDAGGGVHLVNPLELARFTTAETAPFLSGAEHFRHAPAGAKLRESLIPLGALACRCVPHATRSTILFEFRRDLDAATESTTRNVECS
jgi:hypothetical protein